MNQYVTGEIIRRLREEKKLTQLELAEMLHVSDKTVSKWENAKGYPDITLVEPLARALGISMIELLAGNNVMNTNKPSDMRKSKWYICPVCGNVIHSVGEAVISCCGITLPEANGSQADDGHRCRIQVVEDEYYVEIAHEMTKQHYISFIAAVRTDGISLVKLYPQGNAQARFRISGTRKILYYCNHHGLMETDIK